MDETICAKISFSEKASHTEIQRMLNLTERLFQPNQSAEQGLQIHSVFEAVLYITFFLDPSCYYGDPVY